MISIEDNIRVNLDHERLFYRNNVGKIVVIFNQKKQTSLERCLLFVAFACLQKTFLYTSGIRINIYVYPYLPVG